MALSGVIVVDKPRDWTSHDVTAKLRGLLGERRIGHGGTLDPMATGVLPVFVGRATRAVELCESADKEYLAGFLPGIVTDTQDITGTVLERREISVSREMLEALLPSFRGEQQQLPPMYSAVKIGGKKLYELARKGLEAERQPRRIVIHQLSCVGCSDGAFLLRVVCSKGTYVRTLVHDMGQALGCGATLSSLRRLRAGRFSLEEAHTIEELQEARRLGSLTSLLTPVDCLFEELPRVTVDPVAEQRCRCGAAFPCRMPDGRYRVYGLDGTFLMTGCCQGELMYTEKSFFEVAK